MCALNALFGAPEVRLVFSPNMSKPAQWTPKSILHLYLTFPAPTKNGAKMGLKGTVKALVRALEGRLVFSRRTSPNHRGGIQSQVRACILCFGHRKKRRENGPRQSIKCTRSCAECASSFFAPNMSKPPRLTTNLCLRTDLMF